ncbi:unnamed protein product, partial [Nesidiocoris tenuis]
MAQRGKIARKNDLSTRIQSQATYLRIDLPNLSKIIELLAKLSGPKNILGTPITTGDPVGEKLNDYELPVLPQYHQYSYIDLKKLRTS